MSSLFLVVPLVVILQLVVVALLPPPKWPPMCRRSIVQCLFPQPVPVWSILVSTIVLVCKKVLSVSPTFSTTTATTPHSTTTWTAVPFALGSVVGARSYTLGSNAWMETSNAMGHRRKRTKKTRGGEFVGSPCLDNLRHRWLLRYFCQWQIDHMQQRLLLLFWMHQDDGWCHQSWLLLGTYSQPCTLRSNQS